MDRGSWWATVCGVTKSQTGLSDQHFHFHALVPGIAESHTLGTPEGEEEAAPDFVQLVTMPWWGIHTQKNEKENPEMLPK